jgi:hypothetical protein
MNVHRWRYDAVVLVRVYSRDADSLRAYSVRDLRINLPSRIAIVPTPDSFR